MHSTQYDITTTNIQNKKDEKISKVLYIENKRSMYEFILHNMTNFFLICSVKVALYVLNENFRFH